MISVGERALAICVRQTGVADLYYSQWAGSDRTVDAVFETDRSRTVSALFETQWEYTGVGCFPAVVRTLDFLSLDILYLLSGHGVAVYLPLWLGIPTAEGDDEPATAGVLLRSHSLTDLQRLRQRIRRVKEVFGCCIELGLLTPYEARRSLLAVFGDRIPHWKEASNDSGGGSLRR